MTSIGWQIGQATPFLLIGGYLAYRLIVTIPRILLRRKKKKEDEEV